MRLRTKMVLSVTTLTFAIVTVLSGLFVGELLRQRIEQTTASNDVLAHEVLLMTRQAVEAGLRVHHAPRSRPEEALRDAVTDTLRDDKALTDVMDAVVRYSPTVQDVSVTDAHGMTLVSTDPDALNQSSGYRTSLSEVRDGGVMLQARQVFGPPRVLEITQTLERNGSPFLVVHVGVRSTFLRNSYAPWLRAALLFAGLAGLASVIAAGLLANLALLPIEDISRRLESLTASTAALKEGVAARAVEDVEAKKDAVLRISRTIERLGEKMRSTEAGYTSLQLNLSQMLDALRDGVLLFTADRRAVMVSDAVANFVDRPVDGMVGMRLEEIFLPDSVLGAALLDEFSSGRQVVGEPVRLETGRQVEISLDRILDERAGEGSMGTMVTLRDTESALHLTQELEVSRRLAAIGRLTAGVGHEVKNPINAMVVHLELLRAKLQTGAMGENGDLFRGAQRHVEILSGEMQRLDRVVQTLADFSRPMDLHLREHDIRLVVGQVMELTALEMQEHGVRTEVEAPREAVMVLVDAELMRQGLLNLLLNGMQAMPHGGNLKVIVRREYGFALIEVKDEGEGIPAEVLPRIFELYFTTKPKGSGIGLAMTYRILQLHGGALEVETGGGGRFVTPGTTFTIKLPLIAGMGEPRRIGGEIARKMVERV